MQSYIGTKIIKAKPMTDMDYEKERAIFNEANHLTKVYKNGYSILPSNNCCSVEPQGYREPKDGYKVMYPDGYISWSPKTQFEEAYRLISINEKDFVKKEM